MLFLPNKKDYSRALHHYTYRFFFLTKVDIGRVRPKVQPLIFLYHFGQKRNPFEYLKPTWQDKES